MCVKPWLSRRVTLGHYDTLMQELMRESRGDFKPYPRMEPEMFREMLDRVGPRIEKSPEIHALAIRTPYGALSTRTETVSSPCGLRTAVVWLLTRNFSQAPHSVLKYVST